MSTTTVNYNASRYVCRELAARACNAYENNKDAAVRLKAMMDGFDTIINNTQTTKEDKELADFAKGFLKGLSSSPGTEKSISGFFKGLIHNKYDDIPLKAIAGWAFMASLKSAGPACYGSLMAQALNYASSKLSSMQNEHSDSPADQHVPADTKQLWSLRSSNQGAETRTLCLLNNGLDEIQKSPKTSTDEKTLAGCATKMIKSVSSDPAMAGAAGTAFLNSIITLNNRPVTAAVMNAINDGAVSLGNSTSAANLMEKSVDGMMKDTLLSQDQKSLLSFGWNFSKKLSHSPALQVAAAGAFLEVIGGSAKPQELSVMVKSISRAVDEVETLEKHRKRGPYESYYENDTYPARKQIIEDGLSELLTSNATSHREKALIVSGREMIKGFSRDTDGAKIAAGRAIIDTLASGFTGSMVPVLAKAVKATSGKANRLQTNNAELACFRQISGLSEATEKEKTIATLAMNLRNSYDPDGNAALCRSQGVMLDALASGTSKSAMEVYIEAVRNAILIRSNGYVAPEEVSLLTGVLDDLSNDPKASPAVRLIAKNGAASKSYSVKVKAFDEIEMIVKKEPGIGTALDRMSKEDDGEQRSGRIEIVDEKFIDIDGVRVSRRTSTN
jgi:hypothetical protein